MRSSASSENTQSCDASDAAWFFWSTYPVHARVLTEAPFARAMSRVPSLLPESTTITSSAHEALSMAPAMWSASLRVMMVTETPGTRGIIADCRLLLFSLQSAICLLQLPLRRANRRVGGRTRRGDTASADGAD